MGAANVERNVEDAKGSSNAVSNIKTEKGGKEELKIVGELSSRGVLIPRVKLVGLIPFSSDYHFPKIHPPKNN